METVEITAQLGNQTESIPPDFNLLAQESFKNNPEMAEAESKLEAEKSRKRQVYSEFLPSLDFTWYYGWHDTSFPPNDYKEWQWMLILKIPIFSGFSSRARLARERALVESLEEQLEWKKRTVTQEVWKAFQELRAAKANVAQSSAYLNSAQEDLRITQGRYKEGLANMVDLIASQASLSLARAKHISSIANLERALVALEKAMGKIPVLERKGENG
jgi:outer membrane protein